MQLTSNCKKKIYIMNQFYIRKQVSTVALGTEMSMLLNKC